MIERIRKSPKRLLINIDEKSHTLFKLSAAKRNITLRQWVYRALVEALRKEESYEQPFGSTD